MGLSAREKGQPASPSRCCLLRCRTPKSLQSRCPRRNRAAQSPIPATSPCQPSINAAPADSSPAEAFYVLKRDAPEQPLHVLASASPGRGTSGFLTAPEKPPSTPCVRRGVARARSGLLGLTRSLQVTLLNSTEGGTRALSGILLTERKKTFSALLAPQFSPESCLTEPCLVPETEQQGLWLTGHPNLLRKQTMFRFIVFLN